MNSVRLTQSGMDARKTLAIHLAAFEALAYRYTGERDIPVHVSFGPANSSCDGSFLAHACLENDPSVADILSAATSALVEHKALQILSGESWLKITLAEAGETSPSQETARFSATLTIPADGQISACLQNPHALCAIAEPEAVEQHYQTLLDALAGDSAACVNKIPLLSPAQRETILGQWGRGQPDAALRQDELLHELFEATADAYGDNAALMCGKEQMTYRQVERRANQLAWHLRSLGVGKGKMLAMLLPRSMDVYVAILGMLKSGAAYVPLDSEYPADRVAYILQDCNVHTLITTSELAVHHTDFKGNVVLLDGYREDIESQPDRRPARTDTGVTPGDLCYVIYTSGSTGRPKGVQIEHRSVCNFVRAEGRIFQVQPTDRVYQGFSIAFDASVEEVWLAMHSGAVLVAGTAEMVRSGPALPDLLTQAGVTVLSCVPTLLSMMSRDVPGLRLLIVGGETCPQDLAERWTRAGRRMVNTYGPTEATVVATYGDCVPGKAVTIGRPMPNYTCYILDRHLQPVPAGVGGELCIGGAGLSRGYVGRDDLTAEKFVTNPSVAGERIYRTGDLARFNAEGDIEFLGRIDTQVKIRGFRVELAEIESVLMQSPQILTAVVAMRTDTPGIQQLVGYVIPRAGETVSEDEVKTFLRARLPVYMIPALLEVVSDLPTLPSGKVDRKRLPSPKPRQVKSDDEFLAPRTDLEKSLATIWEGLFKVRKVGRQDDFFLELGGHSLLAAAMVSQMRKNPEFADMSVADVYNHTTVETLAAELEARQVRRSAQPKAVSGESAAEPLKRVSTLQYYLCATGQFAAMLLIIAFYSLQWITPYLTYSWLSERGTPMMESIFWALTLLLAFYPVTLVMALVIKWGIIGRYKPGRHAVWGWYFLRWWFVNQFLEAVPIDHMDGTPLLNIFYRLMGAKIGKNVFLGTDNVRTFDLVSIGDNSSIGAEASLNGFTIENGVLHVGPVHVGKGCFIGARTVLRHGSRMEDGSSLCDLSLLPEGQTIPAGQTWIGSPGRATTAPVRPAEMAHAAPTSPSRRTVFGLLHVIGILLLPVVYLTALFPGVVYMNYLSREYGGYWFILASPVLAIVFIVLMAIEIALVKWLFLGRVRPGRYPVASWFYLRKWFVDQLMDMSLDLLGPLYATLYFPPWYRLMGAKIGKKAEISTACSTSPDLVELGDESFIADGVSLGAARVENGYVQIATTRIGKRAFVGNSAAVPAGTVIGDGALIGCLSAPPISKPGAEQNDTSWLGSPAIFLPQRLVNTAFSAEATFKPTAKLYAQRLFIEFFRITLPTICFVVLSSFLLSAVSELHDNDYTVGELLLAFPVLYLLAGVAAVLIVVAFKWIVMGRYRPSESPLWSGFVWRTELLTAMHENLADPFLVHVTVGTPLVNWFFRMLGAKIGSRVYLDTTYLTEFDLVNIGDDVCINSDVTIQTHLFEDRVMKMSTVEIGDGCSVGMGSIVLYDTAMGAGSTLGDLSLLMKGESLPADTMWEGAPARLIGNTQKVAVCVVKETAKEKPATQSAQATHVAFLHELESPIPADSVTCVWVLNLDDHRQGETVEGDGVTGRQLAGVLAGKRLNLPPEQVHFQVDPHGRLSLATNKMPHTPLALKLDVNIAHSQNLLVVGLTLSGRIGVDVEVLRTDVDITAISDTCLTQPERDAINSLPAGDRTLAFFRCWTAKEAYLKATGLGLAAGMHQVETTMGNDGEVQLRHVNGSRQLVEGWQVIHRQFTIGGREAIGAVVVSK